MGVAQPAENPKIIADEALAHLVRSRIYERMHVNG